MEIRLSAHSAYRTEYHIVWLPKYRYHVLNPGVKAYLVKLFPKVMAELPGYFVSTVGGEEAQILKYVEYQGRQDSGQAKLEM